MPVLVPKRHWWGLKSFEANLESKTLGISDLQERLTCLLPSRYPHSLENRQLWQGLRHLFTSSCSESLPSRLMSTSEWSFFLKGSFLPWLLASFLLPRCCDLNGTSMPLAQTGHSSSTRPVLIAFWVPPSSPWPCTYQWYTSLLCYLRGSCLSQSCMFSTVLHITRTQPKLITTKQTQSPSEIGSRLLLVKANLHCGWGLSQEQPIGERDIFLTVASGPQSQSPKYHFPVDISHLSSLEPCSRFPHWQREIGNVDFKCLQSLERKTDTEILREGASSLL